MARACLKTATVDIHMGVRFTLCAILHKLLKYFALCHRGLGARRREGLRIA